MKTKHTGAPHFRRRIHAMLVLLVGATMLSVFSGCGTQPAVKAVNMAATATARAQVTAAAQPVVITADVRQEGTVAAQNVTLVMEAQVRNQPPDLIYLALFLCARSLIHVELYDGSVLVWRNWGAIPCPKPESCPPTTTEDGIDPGVRAEQMVAPGATYSWSMRGDFNHDYSLPGVAPQASKTYTVQISAYWISQPCTPLTPTPPVPLHTITLTQALTLR